MTMCKLEVKGSFPVGVILAGSGMLAGPTLHSPWGLHHRKLERAPVGKNKRWLWGMS
jgi:hypothetical protein